MLYYISKCREPARLQAQCKGAPAIPRNHVLMILRPRNFQRTSERNAIEKATKLGRPDNLFHLNQFVVKSKKRTSGGRS
jgi:hypothetical protein